MFDFLGLIAAPGLNDLFLFQTLTKCELHCIINIAHRCWNSISGSIWELVSCSNPTSVG